MSARKRTGYVLPVSLEYELGHPLPPGCDGEPLAILRLPGVDAYTRMLVACTQGKVSLTALDRLSADVAHRVLRLHGTADLRIVMVVRTMRETAYGVWSATRMQRAIEAVQGLLPDSPLDGPLPWAIFDLSCKPPPCGSSRAARLAAQIRGVSDEVEQQWQVERLVELIKENPLVRPRGGA